MLFFDKPRAKRMLKSMGTGTCAGKCRTVWLNNIRRSLKAKTNPLNLTEKERDDFKKKLEELKGGKLATKKYKTSIPCKRLLWKEEERKRWKYVSLQTQ